LRDCIRCEAYRYKFNAAMDTNTELLPDNKILNRLNERAREGFAKKRSYRDFLLLRALLKAGSS
jgi:hypothetical protein